MRKHRFKVTVNNKSIFSQEGISYPTVNAAQKALERYIWQLWHTKTPFVEGQKGLINASISWECTMNRRAPKRAAAVIAAEQAARAIKSQKYQANHAKYEKERQVREKNIQTRIKHQVDHAFAVGKSGTEPASKYITCQHCEGPAANLLLSQKILPGVCVIDEDTITGATCSEHDFGSKGVVKIPCSKLEFFYDGVRQIAIKP
jgi:hypothetical protein